MSATIDDLWLACGPTPAFDRLGVLADAYAEDGNEDMQRMLLWAWKVELWPSRGRPPTPDKYSWWWMSGAEHGRCYVGQYFNPNRTGSRLVDWEYSIRSCFQIRLFDAWMTWTRDEQDEQLRAAASKGPLCPVKRNISPLKVFE